jgi:cytochrome bd-type quinol oxidase subunit 2
VPGAVIGVVLAAVVISLGLLTPTQQRFAARLYRLGRGWRLPVWLGVLAAVTLLVATLSGAGGSHGAALSLVVVVSLLVLFGLAIGWSWARLRLMP